MTPNSNNHEDETQTKNLCLIANQLVILFIMVKISYPITQFLSQLVARHLLLLGHHKVSMEVYNQLQIPDLPTKIQISIAKSSAKMQPMPTWSALSYMCHNMDEQLCVSEGSAIIPNYVYGFRNHLGSLLKSRNQVEILESEIISMY